MELIKYCHVTDGDIFIELMSGFTYFTELNFSGVDVYDSLYEAYVDTGHHDDESTTNQMLEKNCKLVNES